MHLKLYNLYIIQVVMNVAGNRMTLSVDGRRFSVPVSSQNMLKMYFRRLYVGGYEDFSNAPWPLYARQGYRGCLEALKVNDIGKYIRHFP
jgi:hypothetical protein